MTRRPTLLSEPELSEAARHPLAGEERWLPVALLAAPLAWGLHLVVAYGLVSPAQRWQSKASLFVVALVSAACSCVSMGLGWRGLRLARLGGRVDAAQRERATFLCGCACVLGAFFLLATLAQCVPAVMLSLAAR